MTLSMGNEYITVRLDESRIPEEYLVQAYAIAENLLHICGLSKIFEEPQYGHKLFFVKEVPQDVPQAGLYWVEVTLPRFEGWTLDK